MFIRMIIIFSLFLGLVHANKLEKVSLQLQWKYQFQFAGFIVAKEKGYYKDAGLDVAIKEYDNTDTMQELEDGKTDFALSNGMIAHKNKKLQDVSLIATYFQRSPLILITQPEIKTALDLKGKTISMMKNNLDSSSLSMLLAYFSITKKNSNIIEPTFKLDDFIAKKVDAITAFRSNELFELDKKHIPYNVVDPVEYGFSTNAINLFTSQTIIQERPELVHKFLVASKLGWEYALSHIDEVALLIHNKYTPSKTVEHLTYEGKVTKKLMLLNLYDIGEINKEFVYKTFKQLVKRGLISSSNGKNKLIYEDKHLNQNGKIDFTLKELAWMRKHPVVTYSEVNWKPLSIIENAHMDGLLGDYMKLISQRSGLKFKYISSGSWTEVLEKFKNTKIDVIPGIGSDTGQLEMGLTSDSYAQFPMVIVTGRNYSYVNTLSEFTGKILAIPRGYESYYFIKENYPKIQIIETNNINEALLLVKAGKADGFVGHSLAALYHLTELHLSTLKIAGVTSFEFKHRYLVTRAKPELVSIINKTLSSITQKDRKQIDARWVQTQVKKSVDLTLFYWILGFVCIVVVFVLVKQNMLLNYNKKLTVLKERLELALSSSDSGIWDWNIQENTLYISPQWKEMLGYKDEELENSFETWKISVHPDDIANVMEQIQNNIQNRVIYKEMTYRLVKKDKSIIWILSKASTEFDKDFKPIRVIGTHINITESKAKELQSLQQAQIIEQIHDGVISTDMNGIIKSYNHGAKLLVEYDRNEILGKHISKIFLEEEYKVLKQSIEYIIQEEKYHTIIRLVKKSKKTIYAELSLSLLKDAKGVAIGVVGYAQDITKRREAEQELLKQKEILDHQAHHDALTNLPNRVLFQDRLAQAIAKAKRSNGQIGVLFIDLDRFKEINDSLGHGIGDEVLKVVASRLQKCLRSEDTLARLGGDEFTILLENLKEGQNAATLAQKIINILSEVMDINGNELYISSSIGISLLPQDGDSCDDLLKYADAAMYKAKSEGRNNYQFYSAEMTEIAFERVLMETSLRAGLKNEEFVVYYQPQVDARDNHIIGMEALVRWQHPTMGLISPFKFISLAEMTGLIVPLDRFVMQSAMKQMNKWSVMGLNPGKLSLNLAMKHLYANDFMEELQEIIQVSGCPTAHLELEVVEGQIMSNPSAAIEILNKIRDLGISLSVDDFGTGYSSLSYLKKLPITKLKIDQSFVRELPDDEDDAAISKAVIALAKSLNLEIIAEGVETKEQKDFLVANECNNIQGYYYSKPVSAEAMQKLLESGFAHLN